uniref:Uncharacterized protein n=1 Tax=Meloidogyne enterolobii TaxID=390850 RepID=A0A6V7ULP0_MELEN|nr:unnamed protein product [Meloidogyne enterolobii]
MSPQQNNLFSFLIKLAKIVLFIICTICWVFQSLPLLKVYLDGKHVELKKIHIASELTLPHLLFCNRFPFTQAGLSSLGQQFNRDSVLSYLRQWLDPSLGANPPEDSLAVPLSDLDRQQAEQTIAQLLPNGRLKQRLEQLMPQCGEMVSSCVIGSKQMGGFDCCKMVQPWLATPRGGICWPFVGNLSSVQTPMESPRGMQITFQISRNSFLSSSLSVHPGIDIFLVPAELQNRLLVAIMHGEAHPLNDKKSLRMDIRRENRVFDHYSTISSCRSTDNYAINSEKLVPEASAGFLCMLETAVETCSCVPMLLVLWTLQNDLNSYFLRRFNASTICTVGEFERCVRPFIEFDYYGSEYNQLPTNNAFSTINKAINKCRKIFCTLSYNIFSHKNSRKRFACRIQKYSRLCFTNIYFFRNLYCYRIIFSPTNGYLSII